MNYLALKKTVFASTVAVMITAATIVVPAHAGGVIADALKPTIGAPAAAGLDALHRGVGKPLDQVVVKPVKWLKKRLGIKW